MLRINFILFLMAMFLCLAHVWAGEEVSLVFTENEKQIFQNYDQFLKEMGFENFSQVAEATLQDPTLTNEQRRILILNRDKLDVINSSRELTAFIIARMSGQKDNARSLERLGSFVGRSLNFGVRGLPDQLPPEIHHITDPQEKAAAAEKFLGDYVTHLANESLADMRADVMSILYSSTEAEALEKAQDARFLADRVVVNAYLERIIANKYLYLETTQARYLGRGLALSIVRFARNNNRPELENRLRKIVLNHGEILDNYISENLVFVPNNKKDKIQSLNLKSGDIIMNYSRIAEEKLSAVRFYPESWTKTVVEFFRTNLGLQTIRQFIPLQQKIIYKQLRGEKLTVVDRFVAAIMNLPIFRRGYNVVGLVDVKTDPKTGLKATWVYKNYANMGLGGVQYEDMRNFLSPGFVDRVGHLRLNADKIKNLSAATLLKDKIVLGEKIEKGIDVQISAQDRERLLNSRESADWIEKEVAPKAIDMMKKMMVGKQVVGHSWGQHADLGLISAAQTVYVAFAAGAGVETREGNDRLGLTTSLKAQLTAEGVGKNLTLISPNTYAWNSDKGSFKVIQLPEYSLEARQMEFYDSSRAPVDSKMYALSNRGFVKMSFTMEQMAGVIGRTKKTAEYQYLLSNQVTNKDSNYTSAKKQDLDVKPTLELTTIGANKAMSDEQMREFLTQLGFRDWVKAIKARVSSGDTWNDVTRVQQERNMQSFEANNAARELAIVLMAQMQSRLLLPEGRTQLANLTAHLLTLQPALPIKKIPPEIESLPEEQKNKAMDIYLAKLLRQKMDDHARSLTADLMYTLFGKSYEGHQDLTRKIYDLSSVLIERMYMDHQTGQTRLLGRAMLALMARQAEIRKDAEIMSEVKTSVERSGLYVENFLGNEWKLRSEDGKSLKSVSVDNLSYVLTRNINAESATIPWGARPDKSLEAQAKENQLIGNPLSAFLVVGDVKNGYSMIDKMKDRAFYKHLNHGFSHIGYVVMKEAKDSDIKMSWVIDNYPHPIADAGEPMPGVKHNAGGLRMVGLEQFFLGSHHSRIIVSNIDKQKFYDYAMEQVAKNGIPKTGQALFPYETYKMTWDETKKPLVQDIKKSVRDDWTVEAKQDSLDRLYSGIGPERFFKMFTAATVEYGEINIEKGMVFTWITPYGQYFKGGGYCSSTGVIMALQATGLTLEPKASRWISLVSTVAKTAYPLAVKANMKWFTENPDVLNIVKMGNMGIVAPSSLAAQSFVTEHTIVTAPVQDIRSRMKEDWSFRLVKDNKWKIQVDDMINSAKENKFRSMQFDQTEIRGFSHDVVHKVEATMGKIGYVFESTKHVLQQSKDPKAVFLRSESEPKKAEVRGSTLRCAGSHL